MVVVEVLLVVKLRVVLVVEAKVVEVLVVKEMVVEAKGEEAEDGGEEGEEKQI